MIIIDTGPLVAAANHDDRDHGRCVELMADAARSRRLLLVPAPVIAEVCYLLERERERGSRVEAAFLRSFRGGAFTLVTLTLADLKRMAELVERYANLPLGGVDAAVIAIAERLNVTDIATLDRRHFSIVRPRHAKTFNLLPV